MERVVIRHNAPVWGPAEKNGAGSRIVEMEKDAMKDDYLKRMERTKRLKELQQQIESAWRNKNYEALKTLQRQMIEVLIKAH